MATKRGGHKVTRIAKTVEFDTDVVDKIQKIADRETATWSFIVRKIVTDHVRSKEGLLK